MQVVHEEPRSTAAKALKKQHLDIVTHGGMESLKKRDEDMFETCVDLLYP